MKRKNIILGILIVISIVLIAFVRFVIKKDNAETQNIRLNFYAENLQFQIDLIIQSYEPVTKMIADQVSDNTRLNQIYSATIYKSVEDIEAEIESHVHEILPTLGELGFERVNFLHQKREITEFNSILNTSSSYKESDENINIPHGFFAKNDSIFYEFFVPIQIDEELIGYLELGFDAHKITEKLLQASNEMHAGFIILRDDTSQLAEHKNVHFIKLNNVPRLLFDADIDLKKDLEKEDIITDKLLHLLETTSETNQGKNSSLYIYKNERAYAIAFNQLNLIAYPGKAFIFSINRDYVLGKTKELNDSIFVINLIIILLAMLGIAYLAINRISILRQKVQIQKSEERLQKLNQSKDKFFSIVAHDLKNPFNGIMGLSGYLAGDYEQVDDEERKEIIQDINLASKSAFNLLQNLLEWTRAQSGMIKNNPVMLDPRNIIELSLETVSNLAKNKDIAIKIKIMTNSKGYADENLVSTVIRNLTTNAIKFSPRGSEIKIIANHHKDQMYFCVKDQGIGLRSEEIDQLFRIDVNFHKRGTEKETGTGLGLKLCKEFVEYCKGQIWVVSDPGKGSSFYFTIPLYSTD